MDDILNIDKMLSSKEFEIWGTPEQRAELESRQAYNKALLSEMTGKRNRQTVFKPGQAQNANSQHEAERAEAIAWLDANPNADPKQRANIKKAYNIK